MLRFVVVSVFDASQLANLAEKPLPVFFKPLADDQQALYARLKEVVQADGIRIEEEPLGRTQGFSQGRRIVIRDGLDSRSGVLTLLHEYAHELLHWQGTGRQQALKVKECHAEAVSYVVAHHFGIRNPFSADYLQQWGNTPNGPLGGTGSRAPDTPPLSSNASKGPTLKMVAGRADARFRFAAAHFQEPFCDAL